MTHVVVTVFLSRVCRTDAYTIPVSTVVIGKKFHFAFEQSRKESGVMIAMAEQVC